MAVRANTMPRSPKSAGMRMRASMEVATIASTKFEPSDTAMKAPPRMERDFRLALIVSVSKNRSWCSLEGSTWGSVVGISSMIKPRRLHCQIRCLATSDTPALARSKWHPTRIAATPDGRREEWKRKDPDWQTVGRLHPLSRRGWLRRLEVRFVDP